MPRQIVPVSDVASILLTQDEGDLRYLPLSYSPPPVDLSVYYTKVQSDARYEPIDTMYTKGESDAKYALTSHLHTGVYQPVGSYALTTHNHDTVYQPIGSYALAAHNHDASYLKLSGGNLSGDLMMSSGVATHWANPANTISAGWRMVDGWGLTHIVNGSSVGTYFSTNGSIYVSGTVSTKPGVENLSGLWHDDSTAAHRSYVGLEGDYGSWRVYSPAVGNCFAINLSNANATLAGNLTVASALYGGPSLTLQAAGPIVVNPSNAYFYPVNSTVNCGYPTAGNCWAAVWTGIVASPPSTQLSINGGFHIVNTAQNGGWIYNRSTGHTFFDGSAGAIVAPEADNKLICGGTGNRWQYVAAVQGGINTSHATFKHNYKPLDPVACTNAVLETDWVSFEYIPFPPPDRKEGETPNQRMKVLDEYQTRLAKDAFTRKQNGYVLGHETHKVSNLFGLADREHASPSADLGILACALQAALKRIAVLEGKPV